MSSHVMGIDVGTGGTRVVIVDASGHIVASVTEEHEPFASAHTGWAEQHPDDWWRAARIAIRKALQESKLRAEQVACIGLSGQMHGAVMLDAAGEVVRPALIWCDVRTQKQCDELTAQIGSERLIELTCSPALTNFTLTKLLWTREHEPKNWQRVRSVMLPKDYVRFKLTGVAATDVADASGTLMLDVARRKWSTEIMKAVQIDESVLPALYESAEVCGEISAAGAEASGLAAGTRVVAGAGDQAAGAVGLGIVTPGTVSAAIGTSGVVFAATDRPVTDPRGRLHTFCHAIPNRWHVMGVTQAAGLSLRWLRDTFFKEWTSGSKDPYDQMTREADAVASGADGLLWAPYLMGERTPYLDPNVRGALVGLTASHGRGHVTRAVLEGVAFSLKDTFTIFDEMRIPVKRVRLGGGGARSPLWRRIQAEVYGREVEIAEAEEGAAYGAAILAGVGVGFWPSVDTACEKVVRVADCVRPSPDGAAVLNSQYQAYRRIYPAMKSIFP
ncbi:MAG TPA: xylulokinase [Candidatus Aquilonibacter sp.]|nr:xylulokinase [Candidatus Aquilonibacter sp.]